MNTMPSTLSDLEKLLSRTGDLGFKRRVIVIMRGLGLTGGEKILDCGCGEGFYSMVMSELHPETDVIAFDYNAELLKKAASWLRPESRVDFRNGDIEKGLPFEDNTFDGLIFTEVLEHLNDDRHALKEIFRVMKPGGVVALTVPNASYPFNWDPLNWIREHLGLGHFNPKNTVLGGVWSYDHKRLYSVEQITELATTAGFRVEETVTLTHHCMLFNYLILRLGKMFYTLIPVSEEVRRSMEKFEWKDQSKPTGTGRLIHGIFDLFKRIDKKNDHVMDQPHLSSVSIGLRLIKTD